MIGPRPYGPGGMYSVPLQRETTPEPSREVPEWPDEIPEGESETEIPEEQPEEIEEEIVWTRGVQSSVINSDGAEIGHALLIDADGADLLDCMALAEGIDGITALLESSEGSYHVWSLAVGDLEEQVLRMLDLRVSDSEHAAQSYRRGYSVLRFASKVRESGETYKERPALLDVWLSETDQQQSRPHAEALLSMAEEQGAERAAEELREALSGEHDRVAPEWIGDRETLLFDSYGTLTDQGKSMLE